MHTVDQQLQNDRNQIIAKKRCVAVPTSYCHIACVGVVPVRDASVGICRMQSSCVILGICICSYGFAFVLVISYCAPVAVGVSSMYSVRPLLFACLQYIHC